MQEIALSTDEKEIVEIIFEAIRPISLFRGTRHEKIFKILYPEFLEQVSFGTGKGGLKKYGTKKYTVDFYDPNKNIAWEIDGRSHRSLAAIQRDLKRDVFLKEVYGVDVFRISNNFVKQLMIKRLKENGVIDGKSN